MHNRWKKLLFLNKPLPIRLWMWSAAGCVIFYLLKFSFVEKVEASEIDMILMAYGIGSIAIFVLIFEFDWS